MLSIVAIILSIIVGISSIYLLSSAQFSPNLQQNNDLLQSNQQQCESACSFMGSPTYSLDYNSTSNQYVCNCIPHKIYT